MAKPTGIPTPTLTPTATRLFEPFVAVTFVTEGLLPWLIKPGVMTGPEVALVFKLVVAGVEFETVMVVTIVATPKRKTFDEVLQHSVLLLST